MGEVKSVWRWGFVAAVIIAAYGLIFDSMGSLILAGLAALISTAWCRLETGRWPVFYLKLWWDGVVKEWRIVHARLLKAFDKAPGYWTSPAADADHAALRADYEALVRRAASREDFYLLAELAHDLKRRGDNPLAKPPALRAQFIGSVGVGGLMGSTFGRWVAIGAFGFVLALLAACGLLWGQTQALERQRDAACSEGELDGLTSRQACRDLGAAGAHIVTIEADLAAFEVERANAAARAAIEAEATRALNAANAQRRRMSQQRLRRAHEDDLAAARDARAPDWDQRLRDLSAPLAVDEPGPAEPAADPSPAG